MKKATIFSSLILSFFVTACSQTHSTTISSGGEAELSSGIPLPENDIIEPSQGTHSVLTPIQWRTVSEDIYTDTPQMNPEVIRYDRYTLVVSSPVGGQKYLLDQLVSVNMGKRYGLSVREGLWNTLQETGFTLCSPLQSDVKQLFSLNLPKVHYKFGPMRLRDALQMLAGEAYQLTLNAPIRQVCFEPRKTSYRPSGISKIKAETSSENEWQDRD